MVHNNYNTTLCMRSKTHSKTSNKTFALGVYTVLAVIWLYKFVYRQVQATLPTLVVNKISHVCTFCLHGLKDCSFSFHLMLFYDLISLVIVEKIVFMRAEETQMSSILLSRGLI